jgi:hypothetical protein
MANCPEERSFTVPPEATEFTSAVFHPPLRNATARLLTLSPAAAAGGGGGRKGILCRVFLGGW